MLFYTPKTLVIPYETFQTEKKSVNYVHVPAYECLPSFRCDRVPCVTPQASGSWVPNSWIQITPIDPIGPV
jgi:hypothetical protein